MRLACVDSGHRFKEKLIMTLIRVFSLRKPPDVVKTLFYRPEVFGAPFSAVLQEVMRGPSPWTVGERELFAAFTSRLNECRF
jgi:hypothetical protein